MAGRGIYIKNNDLKVISTEAFIAIVKKHPILYDSSHSEYRNSRKRERMWDQIAKQYGDGGEDLKKRWKSLRDTYAKHLRRIYDDPRKKKWLWAGHMKFFLPYLNFDSKYNSVAENDEPPCNGDDNVSDISKECTSKKSGFLGNKSQNCILLSDTHDEHDNADVESTVNYMGNSPQYTTEAFDTSSERAVKRGHIDYVADNGFSKILHNSEYNETECILLAYAKSIKKFSPKRQATTKFKIAQVVMEQELLQIEETELERTKMNADVLK